MKYKKKDLIVGLDIGTSKICAIVGKVKEGKLDILGAGVGRNINLSSQL